MRTSRKASRPFWKKQNAEDESHMTTLPQPIITNPLRAPSGARPDLCPHIVGTASPAAACKVLILDGNTRSALAATRSLGQRGLAVVVGDSTKPTLAGSSRHCMETITYPDPRLNPEAFVSTIRKQCGERGVALILPMTDVTVSVLLKHRRELQPLLMPFPDFSTFDQVTDKWKLVKLAQQLRIPAPKTEFVEDIRALPAILRKISFPAVLKPLRSMTYTAGRWSPSSVKYASTAADLERTVAQDKWFSRHPFLIQEYITGQSCGIFALYNRGKAVLFFSHRRLRENPPSGGVSVLCESTTLNAAAAAMAKTLLDSVGWHGVAMVEFKISPEGIPCLIEVNGRFWGSLQLAIDAGVDFPWLVYQLAVGAKLDDIAAYTVGTRSRWLLGDLAALFKALFCDNGFPHLKRRQRLELLLDFVKPSKVARGDVNRCDDLRPFLLELGRTIAGVVRRLAADVHAHLFTGGRQQRIGETIHHQPKSAIREPIAVLEAATHASSRNKR